MTAVVLEAEKRDAQGKSASRALRRDGKVPAIIYGGGEKEERILIERRVLSKELNKGGFTSRIVELKVGGKNIKALPKDVQFHPVTDEPEHADFLRVKPGNNIRVWVKLEVRGKEKCPGIKRGGVLNIVRHEIEVICDPEAIPTSIPVSIENLGIGQSAHINDALVPAGVEPAIRGRNFTLVSIAGRAPEEDLNAPVGAQMIAPVVEGEEAVEGAEGAEAAAPAAAGDAKAKAAAPAAEKAPAKDKK